MEGENVDSRNKLKLICKLLADYDHENNLVIAELT